MKKLGILLSLCLLMVGMSLAPVFAQGPPEPIATEKQIRENLADGGEEYITLDFTLPSGVTGIVSAYEWVRDNVYYASDSLVYGETEYWATSSDTLTARTFTEAQLGYDANDDGDMYDTITGYFGDCEDQANLVVAFMRKLDAATYVDIVRTSAGRVGWGPWLPGKGRHTWVEWWDATAEEWVVYDPTWGVTGSWDAYKFAYAANHEWLFNWYYGIKEKNLWPYYWH